MVSETEMCVYADGDPFFVGGARHVKDALGKWFSESTRDLKMLKLGLGFSSEIPSLNYLCAEEWGLDVSADFFVLFGSYAWLSRPEVFELKEKVEAIENAVPGLGETALWCLYRRLYDLIPVFTVGNMLFFASDVYWMGHENESLMEEECYLDGENYEGPTRESLVSCYPSWVINPAEKLKEVELLEIVGSKNELITSEVKKVAEKILEIGRFDKSVSLQSACMLNGCHFCLLPSVLFRWDDKDTTAKVFDDYVDLHYNADGLVDLSTLYGFDLGDYSGFRAWMKEAEEGLLLLRQVDLLTEMLVVEPGD